MQEPCTPDQRPAIHRQYQVVVKISGVQHWLWRAVDQDGFVLDVLVQSRRNKAALSASMAHQVDDAGWCILFHTPDRTQIAR
jgi:hypothetical protein